MFRAAVAVAVIVAALPTYADGGSSREWTRRDVALEAVFAAEVFLDWQQTRWVIVNGAGKERNPILGRDPSIRSINLAAAAGVLAHAGVTAALPRRYRDYWLAESVVLYGAVLTANYAFFGGVHLQF